MATKIKDQASAERAAMKLNEGIEVADKGEPNTPREKTTSERLFPAFTTDDGAITNRPVRPTELSGPLPVMATPESVPQDQTPKTETPTTPTYLKLEEMVGKMVKTKVDGVEKDVPADEVFRSHQLERHLNAQLMQVAQERKQLEDDKRRFVTQPIEPQKPVTKEPAVKKAPEVEALEQRLIQMEQAMAQERALLMPQIQEAGIKRVEQMAKDRLGTDDFRTYFEKIRNSALEEAAKPDVSNNPQARAYFDSDAYYFQKYQELKLKDLITKPSVSASVSNAPVLQTPEGAPVVISNSGKPVSIPSFESSGGVPSRVSPDASWQSTYNALFQRAKESNSQEDWVALYRHKTASGE
jgi:hypothetical protein